MLTASSFQREMTLRWEDKVHAGMRHHIFFPQTEIGVPKSSLQPQKHNKNAEGRIKRHEAKVALEKTKAEAAFPLGRSLASGRALPKHTSSRENPMEGPGL